MSQTEPTVPYSLQNGAEHLIRALNTFWDLIQLLLSPSGQDSPAEIRVAASLACPRSLSSWHAAAIPTGMSLLLRTPTALQHGPLPAHCTFQLDAVSSGMTVTAT